MASLKRDLMALQRRMETACQIAPFLPCDPSAAKLPMREMGALLAAGGGALAEALSRHGSRHQWEVALKWSAEPVLSARRDQVAEAARKGGGGREALAAAVGAALAEDQAMRSHALAEALAPISLAAQPGQAASETEARFTVLIERGTERLIEGALAGLPGAVTHAASADLRGPMPPIAFAAMRVQRPDPAACRKAWDALGLPAMIEAAELPALYRRLAFVLHPDRGGAAPAMAEAAEAFRLLRDVTAGHQGALARGDLERLARPRLALPAEVDQA